jgi:hypothetical protein
VSTLADIRKAAEADVHCWPSDSTPGHFIASTVILGFVTDYLCRGDQDDDAASVAGRIVWPPYGSGRRPYAYRGDSLNSGDLIAGTWTYATEAFAAMVAP